MKELTTYEKFKATREKNHGPFLTKEYKALQAKAVKAVSYAVKAGKLPSLSRNVIGCTDCYGRAECYDHHDYTKLLDVEPVCRRCNVARGKTINSPYHTRGTK